MILLMRHGPSVDPSFGVTDDRRWLTAEGRVQVAERAREIAGRGLGIDAILVSPLVRAVQTAEIVSAVLGYAGAIESADELRPSASPRATLARLEAAGAVVLAVSHEPLVSTVHGLAIGQPSRGYRTSELRSW